MCFTQSLAVSRSASTNGMAWEIELGLALIIIFNCLIQNHSGTALTNNVIWMLLFMLAPPIGLGIALFLNQQVRGIRLVKALFFFPFVISQVVIGLVFSWFYDPNLGLLNSILSIFGFETIALLSSEEYVTYGIIIAGLWPQIAYCMILYLTGLNSLNPEQIEAARLDRAKGLKNVALHYIAAAISGDIYRSSGHCHWRITFF